MSDRSREQSRRRRNAQKTSVLPYSQRVSLLTAGERRFFHQGLNPAIGKLYLVSFKVRLADVITVEDWRSSFGRKIAQKHLDFVLLSPKATRIVAAIELNDATHDLSDRQRRDDFLRQALDSARVPFITFPIYREYDQRKIRSRVLATITRSRRARDRSNR